MLTEDDIRERQEEMISRVSAIFSVPRESACVLLRHYKWSVPPLQQLVLSEHTLLFYFRCSEFEKPISCISCLQDVLQMLCVVICICNSIFLLLACHKGRMLLS